MYTKKDEPITDKENRYLKRRQNKFDYTNDDQDKGKAPETGNDKEGEEFARTLLVAIKDLAREIKEMRMYRMKESPRIFHPGEISGVSHHWNDKPVNQPQTPQVPQRSTMPAFLAVENEGTHEQASLED